MQKHLEEKWDPYIALGIWGDDHFDFTQTLEEAAAEDIKSVQKEGPCHLLVYSFGGLIAYEVARLLKGNNEQVASLTLVEPLTPIAKTREMPKSNMELFFRVLRKKKRFPSRLFGALICNGLRIPVPPSLGVAAAHHYCEELTAVNTLKPYSGDVSLFIGKQFSSTQTACWQKVVEGELTLERIDANTHFDIVGSPHVEAWAALV